MPHIGKTFTNLSDITIMDKQSMIRTLSDLHLLGYIHGDARFQNCVKVGQIIRWIDFSHSGEFTPDGMFDDIKRLLNSLGLNPDVSKITTYVDNIYNKVWLNNPIDIMQRNNLLYSMLN